ncbi:D-alanyl-D-alanine carboxypeptidase/D-alanyl-D-alanine endopeptidase [Demequina pelophila]|uniref:D-alanyl-D-alanine carboxypeptidase/D-alanyl-D-alanine endopeptidase n=1 Tax=Demequina pelophila TaxID=1638984 RepID=UPI000B1A911F|nr:D-alanyl-D-alanine carboxypeptidase/D-alanyl-D-alanine-endopeptidase [Demequina pelophila]
MRNRWVGAAAGVLALGAAGYAALDAYDLAPGWVTLAPEDVPQAPFITAGPVTVSPAEAAVPDLDPDAPRPDAAQVQALAQAVRDDARTGDSTNIAVVDFLDGTVYADLDAADPQVPASTTKLLTAVAAVAYWGPDHRFVTSVTWDDASSTLTLVAGGDEMLAAGEGHGGDATGDDAANGWAGIADLADQVVEALGDSAGEVAVAVDDSAYPGPAWPEVWPEYARWSGYAAPVSGLAVNVGRLTDDHYAQRATDTSLAAGEVLAEALRERGLSVGDGVARVAEDEAGAEVEADAGEGDEAGDGDQGGGQAAESEEVAAPVEVARVESAPLSAIATLLLSESDNTVSEAVARSLNIARGGPGTGADGAQSVVAVLKEIGVDTTGLVLHDGAGFAEDNGIPPATLVSAMRASLEVPELEELLDWLPLSGLEGTVETRYAGTPVAARWRAKTGSLTGVTTIAGVIMTADGRALAVALMADGMPYGQARPIAAFDEFLTALAECGCDG